MASIPNLKPQIRANLLDQTKPETDGCLVVKQQWFNYPEMSINYHKMTPDVADIQRHLFHGTSTTEFMSN